MNRAALFLVLAFFILFSAPAFAVENELEGPAAFVEGTKEYTIGYFDRIRAALSEHFTQKELAPFDAALAGLKEKNARLLERIASLRARKDFLKEKDAALLRYRQVLAKTTDIMFGFLRKLNEGATLPAR